MPSRAARTAKAARTALQGIENRNFQSRQSCPQPNHHPNHQPFPAANLSAQPATIPISQPFSPTCSQTDSPTICQSRQRMLWLQVRSRSAQLSGLSRTAVNRCHSSPSAPLFPPQGPAAPSLAAPLCHALLWHFARHQAVAERKQGWLLCDSFAQRQGLGWNPSMDSCPDL